MTTTNVSTSLRHHIIFRNGADMKNTGISSRVWLLAVLTGLRPWASSAAPGQPNTRRAGSTPDHPERGDVPGWVMITLMSAVLVAALLALAGPALETMFNQAMDKVGS